MRTEQWKASTSVKARAKENCRGLFFSSISPKTDHWFWKHWKKPDERIWRQHCCRDSIKPKNTADKQKKETEASLHYSSLFWIQRLFYLLNFFNNSILLLAIYIELKKIFSSTNWIVKFILQYFRILATLFKKKEPKFRLLNHGSEKRRKKTA